MRFVADARVQPGVRRHVELGRVGVVGVEVGRVLDQRLLGGGEVAQEARDVGFDARWVVAGQVDGVGEPAFVEVPGALDGGGVGGGVGEGDFVAAVVLVGDGGVGAEEGFAEVVGLGVG